MKPEDAINWLNELMPKWDYEANIYGAEPYCGLGHYVCTEPEGYVFKKAIEALEKQIPKKPHKVHDVEHKVHDVDENGHLYFTYVCVECGNVIDEYEDYFCPNCGQAIDWDDE